MKRITFHCVLESDVIITQKAATVGNQDTLDFIPGSNFYGMAANRLYNETELSKEDLFTLLHSGKLRFGDAHPAKNGKRSLRIPADMLYEKSEGKEKGIYLYHALAGIKNNIKKEKQLKQCRSGFYLLERESGYPVEVEKNFALKSAYDHNARRSKDEQMFGYRSISKGTEFLFYLTYDENRITEEQIDLVVRALEGRQRVGYSRSAQYGLVKIKKDESVPVNVEKTTVSDKQEVIIYADGRLIFFDQYQLPTCTPTALDFGFDQSGDRILWEKSQIRTFQYTPWNFARQARDADRYGIEKGSVIVIRLDEKQSTRSIETCVGLYRTEGFGDILINPPFLEADKEGNGTCRLQGSDRLPYKEISGTEKLKDATEPLLKYLYSRAKAEAAQSKIYTEVNDFIKNNRDKFTGKEEERFAAQWGAIRNIAFKCSSVEELQEKLFSDANAYLTSGIAATKWKIDRRSEELKTFIEKFKEEENVNVLSAVVNLASEMAKVCSKKNKTQKEEKHGKR